MKQSSQQRAEKKRFEKRPRDGQEQRCNGHHEQQDKRRAQVRAAYGRWFHGSAPIPLTRLIADLPHYIVSFNPRSSSLQQVPQKTNNSPSALRAKTLQSVQAPVCLRMYREVSLIPAARISRTS